jgi:hypothetical protein
MKRFLIAAAALLCAPATGSAQDIPLSKILVEGEGWKVAAKDLPGVTFLHGDSEGSIVVVREKTVGKITSQGQFVDKQPPRPPYGSSHSEVVVLPIGWYSLKGRKLQNSEKDALNLEQLSAPTCLVSWPSQHQLVIGDAGGDYLWTARIGKNGELSGLDRYYSLRTKPGDKGSGVKAMVMDAGNLLYAATPLGVQVFDPTGRLCGVILPPAKDEMTAITIGGEKGDTLFVAAGDKVYSRKIQGKAVYTLKKDK